MAGDDCQTLGSGYVITSAALLMAASGGRCFATDVNPLAVVGPGRCRSCTRTSR